jgi:hypothetical protein
MKIAPIAVAVNGFPAPQTRDIAALACCHEFGRAAGENDYSRIKR